MKFLRKGKFTTLQGDCELVPEQAQLHCIRRMVATNSIAEVYSLQLMEPDVVPKSMLDLPITMEPELALLLHTYNVDFDTPSSLPSQRSHEHSIPLLSGSQPVKVKPYKYPHSQNEEIKRLVSGMLDEASYSLVRVPFLLPLYW